MENPCYTTAILGLLAAAACTADNPAYQGIAAGDGASPDRTMTLTMDGRGVVDGGAPASADPSRFGFEVDTQRWADVRADMSTPVRRSTTRAFRGAASLEISLATTAASDYQYIGVTWANGLQGSPLPGQTVTFHLWIPLSGVSAVQPFILYVPAGGSNSVWGGALTFTSSLTRGQWNTFTQKVPTDAQRVIELGVEWRTEGAWKGSVFVDSVDW